MLLYSTTVGETAARRVQYRNVVEPIGMSMLGWPTYWHRSNPLSPAESQKKQPQGRIHRYLSSPVLENLPNLLEADRLRHIYIHPRRKRFALIVRAARIPRDSDNQTPRPCS